MASLFEFHDVGFSAGSVSILQNLNGTIPLSGVTVLRGPSGSGKTSLLRLLNGLEVPTTGYVSLDGVDLGDIAPQKLRRKVGMVFQRPAMFEGSVLDNLRVAKPQLDRSAALLALAGVGLDEAMADRAASLLSGGEGQRVCLARALLIEPEVLVLDEPTASLDQESVAVIETHLLGLARGGLPQVWVSHDPEQVERIADAVIELSSLSRSAGSGADSDMGPEHDE